ncbi:UDP-N-acetylglucosamine acyltransferase [Cellulomonas xylanilytica]|uniref:Acyl-[acyl-carrier-protein]--UDP-N-acetylglucosamine O-acyltransferase n=1 Tax=Cellulomonas xylanilytica TaxID=233583 RepID=A0A510V446_9CELL|nr:UDP-N-acetylglucosamine acyltransferase [Cellulomonas xylanilytica]GEK21653.1 acyl-[acyl-carrier-protein]--UDP-N-acetylglucosamine O-acyltransferase [Cellulomonas xylanilytica]
MNSIHPTAVIGDGVVLGDGNVIGPYVVLYGPLEIGDGNWIGPGVTLGTPPEVRGVEHGAQWESVASGPGISIGHRNVIREQTLIHQGWKHPTVVGDDCFLMNKVYVAHDSVIENGCTLASTVTMGGHVRIGAGANVGLGTVVHQRRFVAAGAMVGMGSVVTRDVPPFALAFGNPARVQGANRVGMTRRGLDESAVDAIAAFYERGIVPGADDVPPSLRDDFLTWEKVSGP